GREDNGAADRYGKSPHPKPSFQTCPLVLELGGRAVHGKEDLTVLYFLKLRRILDKAQPACDLGGFEIEDVCRCQDESIQLNGYTRNNLQSGIRQYHTVVRQPR